MRRGAMRDVLAVCMQKILYAVIVDVSGACYRVWKIWDVLHNPRCLTCKTLFYSVFVPLGISLCLFYTACLAVSTLVQLAGRGITLQRESSQ